MKTFAGAILGSVSRGFFFNGVACFVPSVIMALSVWFTGRPAIDLIPSLYAYFISLFLFVLGLNCLSIQQMLQPKTI